MVCLKLFACYPYIFPTIFLISVYATLSNLFLLGRDAVSANDPNGAQVLRTALGDYCLLPAVFSGAPAALPATAVTFVSHASVNYLPQLVDLATAYDGPLSVAIYLHQASHLPAAYRALQHLKRCHQHFDKKVNVHIFYKLDSSGVCELPQREADDDVQCEDTLKNRFELDEYDLLNRNSQSNYWYPVNLARNIARSRSTTKYELVADIELLPSPRLYDRLQRFLSVVEADGRSLAPTVGNGNEAFVIPVFEVEQGLAVPRTKAQLSKLVSEQWAVPFHSLRIAQCHRIPRLATWLRRPVNDSISVFGTVSWLRPCWEPVFVATAHTPAYDNRFIGYGKNKIQQASFNYYYLAVRTVIRFF